MTEFELIARLTARLPVNSSVVVGVGDDCAVLESSHPDEYLLFKTDALVEGIHFTREAPPERIGHKALARCLSDVAAMGGSPMHALITLGLPEPPPSALLERIYGGLGELAARYGVAVVGGETVKNPERIFISVALLGKVARTKCILRSGAQVGDAIFVTGSLGGSISGKHLEFEPRLAQAQWLTENFKLHAMIDLSDGLAGDLRHVLKASNAGAELLARAIPISRAARAISKAPGAAKTPLLAALTDGEDFELLFTMASRDAVRLLDRWKQAFPKMLLSCIGKITASRGLVIRTPEGVRPVKENGYVHFA